MESKRYGKRKVGMPKKNMENGINEIAKKGVENPNHVMA